VPPVSFIFLDVFDDISAPYGGRGISTVLPKQKEIVQESKVNSVSESKAIIKTDLPISVMKRYLKILHCHGGQVEEFISNFVRSTKWRVGALDIGENAVHLVQDLKRIIFYQSVPYGTVTYVQYEDHPILLEFLFHKLLGNICRK
jgi:hypothetical protein